MCTGNDFLNNGGLKIRRVNTAKVRRVRWVEGKLACFLIDAARTPWRWRRDTSSAWTLLRGGIYDRISHIYPAPQCFPPSSSPSPSQEWPPTHTWPDWPGYMFFCVHSTIVCRSRRSSCSHTAWSRTRGRDVSMKEAAAILFHKLAMVITHIHLLCKKNSYVDVEGCTGTQVVLSRSISKTAWSRRWYNEGNVCILFHKPALLRHPVIIQIIL